MVVKIGGEMLKGEEDVRAWIQSALPSSQPFGVFVDVHVVLEMILLGYTSVQAATMERHQKNSLETDEALIIKTFENKLLMLFGRPMSNGSTVKMVTSTKNSWLPEISNFGAWETSNRLGGLKAVIQQQIGTVERHFRASIGMNLREHTKARTIAISCVETSLAFLSLTCNFISITYRDLEVSGFPSQITWQLVTKLVYQVFAGDLDDQRGFMQILHGTQDHLALTSRTIWAIFKTNK
eukprot:2058626-Ditylum_brightwellii.AAC.1